MTEPLTNAEVKRLASSMEVMCFFGHNPGESLVRLVFPIGGDYYGETDHHSTLQSAYEALMGYRKRVNLDD